MSQQTISQPADATARNADIHTRIQQIAVSIVAATGAQECYILFAGSVASQPYTLVSASGVAPSASHVDEVWRMLQRADAASAPVQSVFDGQASLALPLFHEGRWVAMALLLYAHEHDVDVQRASTIAMLAASSLGMARQIASLYLHAEEIEERARLREIQISRNLIRSLIDAIPLGLVLLDLNGTVLAINRALSARFGLDPASLVGAHYSTVIGSWDTSAAHMVLASGRPERIRRSLSRSDGGQNMLEISCFPLHNAESRPYQVVEVWDDITERVTLQTQLVRAEKLAAIGQLAASIAHEVGNPLQAIQGFLMLFLDQNPPETPNRNFLELAQEEIERIVQVIARLRDLYRPRADVIASVKLNTLVDHVLLLTSKQLERANVRVVTTLQPDLPSIQGVADQLKQVLLNLVLNAIDAMPNGGVLRVETKQVAAFGEESAVVTLADNGLGISADQLPHIFNGLHTTKERGMGMGLYTSKAIIERHLGRITVESNVGTGTMFTITLPVGMEEPEL